MQLREACSGMCCADDVHLSPVLSEVVFSLQSEEMD